MKQNRNGWFAASELPRFLTSLAATIEGEPAAWLQLPQCKYIQPRIDMRTGDFIIKDQDGQIVEPEELYTLLPSVRD